MVFQMRAWASPGPDGFQKGFYQISWEEVSDDPVAMVQHFFRTCYLLKQLNYTYQVLIPKKLCVETPSDFRPIGLCNISYKVISKTLANRLKKHLHNIISPWQAAFVPGRNILDNTIIAHELIAYIKKTHIFSGAVAIKLDILIEWIGVLFLIL